MNRARRERQKARRLAGTEPAKRARKVPDVPEVPHYVIQAGLASAQGTANPEEKKG